MPAFEHSTGARGAFQPARETDSQLERPRAIAAPWGAQQVVADQPVVGNPPDLVAGQGPDPDAANEVLANATDGAEGELQPGGRGRDRRRDVELDGQLREAKLDAVLAGCRRTSRPTVVDVLGTRVPSAGSRSATTLLAPRSRPVSTTDAASPAEAAFPSRHRSTTSAPSLRFPARSPARRRRSGRSRSGSRPDRPSALPDRARRAARGRAVDAHTAREGEADRVRGLAVRRQHRHVGRDQQRRALAGDARVEGGGGVAPNCARAGGAGRQRQREAGPRGYPTPAQPRCPLSAAGDRTMIRPRFRRSPPRSRANGARVRCRPSALPQAARGRSCCPRARGPPPQGGGAVAPRPGRGASTGCAR